MENYIQVPIQVLKKKCMRKKNLEEVGCLASWLHCSSNVEKNLLVCYIFFFVEIYILLDVHDDHHHNKLLEMTVFMAITGQMANLYFSNFGSFNEVFLLGFIQVVPTQSLKTRRKKEEKNQRIMGNA